MTKDDYGYFLKNGPKLLELGLQTVKPGNHPCVSDLNSCISTFFKGENSFHCYDDGKNTLYFLLLKHKGEKWLISYLRAFGSYAYLRLMFKNKIQSLQKIKKEDFYILDIEDDHDRSFESELDIIDKAQTPGYWTIKCQQY